MSKVVANAIIAKDISGNDYRVDASILSWRPSVYGIVIEDGNILMTPQFKGRFSLPGGGVELGEELDGAVVREVKEETGIDVEVVRVADVRSSIFANYHNDEQVFHSILIYYVCKKIGGELSIEGFDEDEKKHAALAEWVPLDKLDSLELASSDDFRDIVRTVFVNGD